MGETEKTMRGFSSQAPSDFYAYAGSNLSRSRRGLRPGGTLEPKIFCNLKTSVSLKSFTFYAGPFLRWGSLPSLPPLIRH